MSIIGEKVRGASAWKLLSGARPARDGTTVVDGDEGSSWWRPRQVSIRTALAAMLEIIIAVTTATLIHSLESGRQNTIALVRDRSERIIDTIVQRTRFHLDPARDQSEFLARLVRDGELDPKDEPVFTSHLRTALAGLPQIAALAVIRIDLKQLRVERQGDVVVSRSIDMRTVPGLMRRSRWPEALASQCGENFSGANA